MPAKLTFVDPYIRVKNVPRSAQWYRSMLGLKVGMAMPENKRPTFVRLIAPSGMALMISDGSDPMSNKKAPKATTDAIAARKAQRVVTFYYRVDKDIDSLFRSVRRKGAKVVSQPQDMPYGMREFAVRDPDGYEVAVGQEIAPAAPPRQQATKARRRPTQRKAPARRGAGTRSRRGRS